MYKGHWQQGLSQRFFYSIQIFVVLCSGVHIEPMDVKLVSFFGSTWHKGQVSFRSSYPVYGRLRRETSSMGCKIKKKKSSLPLIHCL